MLPSPSRPSVRPRRSLPTVLCHGPFARNDADSGATCLARPRISAQVSSAGGSRPLAVPHTVTPCSRAASRSMAAFRIPPVTSSFSFGRRANSDLRERRALAHDDDDLAVADERRQFGLVRHVAMQRTDVDSIGECAPVRAAEGYLLVVVQDRASQCAHGP